MEAPSRHPHLVYLAGKSLACSRGGGSSASQVTLNQTREAAVLVNTARADEIYSVLVARAIRNDPTFDLDEWAPKYWLQLALRTEGLRAYPRADSSSSMCTVNPHTVRSSRTYRNTHFGPQNPTEVLPRKSKHSVELTAHSS